MIKPFTFNVLQKHIDEGKCGDPVKCVIALALLDHFKEASPLEVSNVLVFVAWGLVQFTELSETLRLGFPQEIWDYIVAFEEHEHIEPQSFTITDITTVKE